MAIIKVGDQVRHKKKLIVNSEMNVSQVEGNKALCEYLEGREGVHKQDWFDTKDLEVVNYPEGGFLKMY